MTNKEQEELWLKFHRFQMRYELIFASKINKELKRQVRQYIDSKDLTYINPGDLYLVLMNLYKTVGPVWARHTRNIVKSLQVKEDAIIIPPLGQMGFSERIVNLMQEWFQVNLLNDANNITQTTIRLIREVLSRAAMSGASFDDIVDELESPEFTAKRARLIARTETVGAANAGAIANAKLAGATKKIWIAARDHRTRQHHREVNQVVIPIDGKFQVGNYFMAYPGDKSGGAEEVCNCRCALGFATDEKSIDYEPYFKKTDDNIAMLQKSVKDQTDSIVEATTTQVDVFTEVLKQVIGDIPAPVINLPTPVVNLPAPVVNLPAPIVNTDQSEIITLVNSGVLGIVAVGNQIIEGQKEIISLQKEALKPKPKKKWEFDTVIEDGRIKKVIAKEI